jgi:hypothetical protein
MSSGGFMSKVEKEARSERVQVSLKPSTLALFQRWSVATGKPVATLITELVEESEGASRVIVGLTEKLKATKEESARKREQSLLKRGGSHG